MTKSKKNHVKIGDKVQVLSGNQKGVIGTIQSLLPKQSIVYIDGILPRLKRVKAKQKEETTNSEANQIELQIPIHISNVMLWDNQSNQASRIGYKMVDEKKRRYFKKSGNFV